MSTTKRAPRKPAATRRKGAATPKATAKPTAPAKPAPEKGMIKVSEEVTPALRKKELVERVVARTGLKKGAAKPVVEAVLAELGETLADGRGLAMPPLGRLKVTREKTLPNGRVMVLRLRQGTPPSKAVLPPAKTPAKR